MNALRKNYQHAPEWTPPPGLYWPAQFAHAMTVEKSMSMLRAAVAKQDARKLETNDESDGNTRFRKAATRTLTRHPRIDQ